MFRLGDFPEREIFGIALVIADGLARPGFLLLDAPVGELAVIRVFADVKIDAAVDLVGDALFQQRLDHLDLFGDVPAGARRDVRARDAQPIHRILISAGVLLRHLHRLGLGLASFPDDPVFVRVEQMPYVGQVLHVEDVVAAVTQIADDHVERDVSLGVPDVQLVVDGGTADVHSNVSRHQRLEILFFTSKNVEYPQGHRVISLCSVCHSDVHFNA